MASKKEQQEKARREALMAEILNSWAMINRNFEWQDDANCKGLNDLFFFDRGANQKKIQTAKKICGACKVKGECLEFALENKFEYGIWGGKTPNERLLMSGLHSWNDSRDTI